MPEHLFHLTIYAKTLLIATQNKGHNNTKRVVSAFDIYLSKIMCRFYFYFHICKFVTGSNNHVCTITLSFNKSSREKLILKRLVHVLLFKDQNIQPSIFTTYWIPFGFRGQLKPIATVGFISHSYLRAIWNLQLTYEVRFWTVERSWNPWREPIHTRGEHANSAWKGFEPAARQERQPLHHHADSETILQK